MRSILKTLSIVLIIGALAVIWVVVHEQRSYVEPQSEQIATNTPPRVEPETMDTRQTYRNYEFDYMFQYEGGADGLVLTEQGEASPDDDASYLGGVMLMESREAATLDDRLGGEGPPTISVRVYENATLDSASAWVQSHPIESNIELRRGETKEFTLGEVDAIRYMVDGLYLIDTVVVTEGQYTYVVSGAYQEENSLIREAFLELLQSFAFVSS